MIISDGFRFEQVAFPLNLCSKKEGKKRTRTGKKAPEKRNFLAEKVIFSVAKPQKPLRQCSAKGGERKQKQPSTIKAGLSLF